MLERVEFFAVGASVVYQACYLDAALQKLWRSSPFSAPELLSVRRRCDKDGGTKMENRTREASPCVSNIIHCILAYR